MTKKRVFIVGSCVTRDLFELTDRYEIAECVSRSSLASAFAEKPFFGPDDDLLQSNIQSNWQRRCVRRDTRKELRALLEKKEYDAIILDFVEERFNLVKHKGAIATKSIKFTNTGLQDLFRFKILKPLNWRRRLWWKQGLNELLSIACKREVPVFLNAVYPAFLNNEAEELNRRYSKKNSRYLNWYYAHTPARIQRFHIEKDMFIADTQHKWGSE